MFSWMKLPERIEAFSRLGETMRSLGLSDRKALAEKAVNENPWFTDDNVMLSLKGIEALLERKKLESWALDRKSVV